ncbi:MAG: sigma-70 family RNA polymerase sigma factor [Gammaproteobacteria bacterium]|jgi:RNA polymerase sigma-70 factor (ECF subfamily)
MVTLTTDGMDTATAGTTGDIRAGATMVMTRAADAMADTIAAAITSHRPGRGSGILGASKRPPAMQADRIRQEVEWPARLANGPAGASINAQLRDSVLPDRDQQNADLEAFFVETEETAFHVAYAALWEREAALDAVQESMTRLVEYYRDKPATHWPALFRTILNSKINDIRRRRLIEQGKHRLVSLTGLFRQSGDSGQAMVEYDLPSDHRDDGVTAPEVGVITKQLRDKVADALQALSERQRQVFILREWRGMSIAETALVLGCSQNSVKQHHFRAMRELRKQLAEVWNHA